MASHLLEGLSASENADNNGWSNATRYSQNAETPGTSQATRSPAATPGFPPRNGIWPTKLNAASPKTNLSSRLVSDTGQGAAGDSATGGLLTKVYSPAQAKRNEFVEPGMQLLSVCSYCGTVSVNRQKCDSCKHSISPDAKTVKKPIGEVSGIIKKSQTNSSLINTTPKRPQVEFNIVHTVPVEKTPVKPLNLPSSVTQFASSSGVSKNTFYGNSAKNEVKNATFKLELSQLNFELNKKATHKAADSVLKKVRQQRQKKQTTKRKIEDPPVCLTISSDDEEDRNPGSSLMSPLTPRRLQEAMNKPDSTTDIPIEEQRLYQSGGAPPNPRPPKVRRSNHVNLDDDCTVSCRSVRIGSYKINPLSDVIISRRGILIHVLSIGDEQPVEVHIPLQDVIRCMAHFGPTMPIVFFYTNQHSSQTVRDTLNMATNEGPYYDPGSLDETQKRVTLVLTKINEEQKRYIITLFKTFGNRGSSQSSSSVLEEIEQKIANEILVRSTPTEIRNMLKVIRSGNNVPSSPSNSQVNMTAPAPPPPHHVVKLAVYPPPPATGGITITSEDFICLKEGEFLNDVIIDFYLKYLLMERLSESDRARTHVFSSFFYKRLTQLPTRRSTLQEEQNLPPAERRHARVKTWSRHVDIFEKDFIIIPINENAHWYLAIICFPALVTPVYKDNNQPVEKELLRTLYKPPKPPRPSPKLLPEGTMCMLNDGTKLVVTTLNMIPDEGEPRDEAEPDDPEPTLDINPQLEDGNSQGETEKYRPIKQPCILIFDSLAGPSRSRVIATLREYLQIEWKVRKRTPRGFTKENIKGANLNVPQQTNFSDCGVYVLQYVETFFEKPVADYRIPIKGLEDWFTEERTNIKREELKNLILNLMREQQVNPDSETIKLLKEQTMAEPDSTTSGDQPPL